VVEEYGHVRKRRYCKTKCSATTAPEPGSLANAGVNVCTQKRHRGAHMGLFVQAVQLERAANLVWNRLIEGPFYRLFDIF
jgi:hypothetical protein